MVYCLILKPQNILISDRLEAGRQSDDNKSSECVCLCPGNFPACVSVPTVIVTVLPTSTDELGKGGVITTLFWWLLITTSLPPLPPLP